MAETPAAVPPPPPPAGGAEDGNPFQRLRTRWLILWVLGGTLVLNEVFSAVYGLTGLALGRDFRADPATSMILMMFAGYGAIAVWLLWPGRRAGVDIRRLVGRVPSGRDWLVTAGLLAVTITFSYGSWELLASALSRVAPGLLTRLVENLPTTPDGAFVHDLSWIVLVVLLAPALEEVLFRGMLMSRWGVKWGIRAGVVASAVCFGFLHANPIGLTVVGLVMTVLYLRTRTLIVPIAFHAANNAVGSMGGLFSGSEEPMDAAAMIQNVDGWLGFLMVAVTLPVLIWYLWRYWPERDAGLPYMDTALPYMAADQPLEAPE